MKPFWEITSEDADACLAATTWCPADNGYFRGGGFSSMFETQVEMPVTMVRMNKIEGLGPVLQIAEGYTVVLPEEVSQTLQKRTSPTWPTTWFVPATDRRRRLHRCLQRHGQLGRQPRLVQLWPYRRQADHPGQHAAHPRLHAQCTERQDLPSACLVSLWHHQCRKRRLPRLRRPTDRFSAKLKSSLRSYWSVFTQCR